MSRFIVSNRMAGARSQHTLLGARSVLDSIAGTLSTFSNVLSDNEPNKPEHRRLIKFECEPADFAAKRMEWGPDVIAEAEMTRYTAVAFPQAEDIMGLLASHTALENVPEGQRAFEVTIRSNGSPVANAAATATFFPITAGAQSIPMAAVTGANGKATWNYDASKYRPGVLLIVPKDGCYSWLQSNPTPGMVLDLPILPKSGPLGWWHHILGIEKYDESRGKGIRIGVADTGVGPHPYLSHVTRVGSFTHGAFNPKGGADIEDHGTHVCGILGARPTAGSNEFGGIAPGADVFCARIFANADPSNPSARPTTTNADLANAIDDLVNNHQVDLINLSLGGETASLIEQDAIQAAMEAGTLTIAAAGNSYGQPVMYPAAYPNVVALSAIGIPDAAPANTLDALSKPDPSKAPSAFAFDGAVYLATFSNIGFPIKCTGPGVGIISTVPTKNGKGSYASMSGTSMASPAVCAALASLLAEDTAYNNLPRNATRASRAYEVLMSSLRRLPGMPSTYVGGGVATAAARA